MADRPPLLDPAALGLALDGLPEWKGDPTGIERTIECSSFPAAIDLVRRVGEVAESMDHHPDIDIRWRTVRFAASTHSAGGVTALDTELAGRIDALAAEAS